MSQTRKMVSDIRMLLADAEELARATASETGDKVSQIRSRLQTQVAAIRPRLAEVEADLRNRFDAVAANTATYVRERPWHAVGIAAAVGLVIGVLVARR